MNNKDWKEQHSGSSGAEMVNLLMDEVEDMMRARYYANGNPNGCLMDYWIDEEIHHLERVLWLRDMLYKKLEGH